MFLVVGLGNPGREYATTRHNIGFMVVDALAGRWSQREAAVSWKSKFGGELAQTGRGSTQVVLLKPQEFMNLSGEPTQRAATFFKVDVKDVIVVHDDIDLEYGTVRVKVGGGHGGHNGLRSLCEHLGPAFIRVRCGVGKPHTKDRVVGHVLGGFSKAEEAELPDLIDRAASAVDTILEKGAVAAMNRHNAEKPRST